MKVLIGKITSVFGIKGQVKILSYCQDSQEIANYPLFDKNNQPISLKITSTKKKAGNQNEILIAKINDISDRNLAEKLIGTEIFTNRDDFAETEENEFYYVDLIGLKVLDNQQNDLGQIKNVLDFGAGSLIEVEFDDKICQERNLKKIENFTFKDEFFPEVNIKKGFIIINFPEFLTAKEENN